MGRPFMQQISKVLTETVVKHYFIILNSHEPFCLLEQHCR